MTDNLIIRELRETDYNIGYMDCVNELTTPVQVDYNTFINRYNKLKESKEYYVLVVEDKKTNKIIGSGTLFLEYKFIRGCVVKGHIEDIVVSEIKRGCGIGKMIVERLIEKAIKEKCYKIALVCDKKNTKFYEKCGFIEKETEMIIYTK